MEALNEQRCPLARLELEQALEPELVRVQALQVQALQVQALVRVQLEPLVLEQAQVQLKPLVLAQLELEQRLQQSCPKLQPHRHRCKAPDRSREP